MEIRPFSSATGIAIAGVVAMGSLTAVMSVGKKGHSARHKCLRVRISVEMSRSVVSCDRGIVACGARVLYKGYVNFESISNQSLRFMLSHGWDCSAQVTRTSPGRPCGVQTTPGILYTVNKALTHARHLVGQHNGKAAVVNG